MQQSKEEYVYAYGIIKGTVYNTTNPKICHLWSKGSPAWRNNNPGMLPLSRNILRSGVIGVADEMAVFKNISAGDRAHRSFLEIECGSMTVEEALYNSLPSDTEDVEEYIKETLERLNATEETLVSDISINELVEAIRKKIEWAKGTIKKIKNPRYIWRTMKDGNVRNKHIIREGLVFEWSRPPDDGNPGEPINCRCHGEPYYPVINKDGSIEGVCIEKIKLQEKLGVKEAEEEMKKKEQVDAKKVGSDSSFTDDDLVNESFDLIKSEGYGEGFAPQAYFDSKGNLTTGYGTKIDTKEKYCAINWKANGRSLTQTQKEVNYEKTMALKNKYSSNMLASSQHDLKVLGAIDKAEAEYHARVHIKENSLKEIKQSFKNAGIDFDSFPPSTRVALIDIHYNSGGVNKGKWPQMMEALQKYDLDSVAKRSNRGAPISKERNNEIARLIIHGKKELQHKLEIGTWR